MNMNKKASVEWRIVWLIISIVAVIVAMLVIYDVYYSYIHGESVVTMFENIFGGV